jgi:hypothetical protein
MLFSATYSLLHFDLRRQAAGLRNRVTSMAANFNKVLSDKRSQYAARNEDEAHAPVRVSSRSAMWMRRLKRNRTSPLSIGGYSSHCFKVPHATG